MTYAATMTMGEIITEVQTLGFTSAQATQIARWVQKAYGDLWGTDNWTFRFTTTSLTIGATDNTPTVPANFGIPSGLWLADGTRLRFLEAAAFYDIYSDTSIGTGTPAHYTVVNEELRLGPTPSAATTATLYYEKRPTQLTESADVPSIPDEHHYGLVFGALAVGYAAYNDQIVEYWRVEWAQTIAAMRRDYLVNQRNEPTRARPFRP